ncbi:MAG: hypothetical protein AAGB11_14475 [Pseudomonadota bacterium]
MDHVDSVGANQHASSLYLLKSALELHVALVSDTIDFFGDDAPFDMLDASRDRVQGIMAELSQVVENSACNREPERAIDSALNEMIAELQILSGHSIVLRIPNSSIELPYFDLGKPIILH